jgi:hypothetical protein
MKKQALRCGARTTRVGLASPHTIFILKAAAVPKREWLQKQTLAPFRCGAFALCACDDRS